MVDLSYSLAIPGWMSEAELRWLHDQAARFNSVLEVGCWKGRSTSALALGCPGSVVTVDHFRGSPSEIDGNHREARDGRLLDEARRNLSGFPRVAILEAPSAEALMMLERSRYEMIFVDGEHTEESALHDVSGWRPRCTRLFCGHDINWPGVRAALEACGVAYQLGPGTIWFEELR